MNASTPNFAGIIDIPTRMAAFLSDTIQHFNSKNRSMGLIHGVMSCVYPASETSEGCAIGRHCPGLTNDNTPLHANKTYSCLVGNTEAFNFIPDWLKQMPTQFVTYVQILHDDPEHWDDEGLTKKGKDEVNDIIHRTGLPMERL